MSMTRRQLEAAAIRGHQAGMMWPEFWDMHRHAIALAEPWNLTARAKLARRLSLLVTAGDLDGDQARGRGVGAGRRSKGVGGSKISHPRV